MGKLSNFIEDHTTGEREGHHLHLISEQYFWDLQDQEGYREIEWLPDEEKK